MLCASGPLEPVDGAVSTRTRILAGERGEIGDRLFRHFAEIFEHRQAGWRAAAGTPRRQKGCRGRSRRTAPCRQFATPIRRGRRGCRRVIPPAVSDAASESAASRQTSASLDRSRETAVKAYSTTGPPCDPDLLQVLERRRRQASRNVRARSRASPSSWQNRRRCLYRRTFVIQSGSGEIGLLTSIRDKYSLLANTAIRTFPADGSISSASGTLPTSPAQQKRLEMIQRHVRIG